MIVEPAVYVLQVQTVDVRARQEDRSSPVS